MELTDDYGVRWTTLRPYLAIDQDPGDSQILLGMTALIELRILIDCQTYQWQYKLDKTSIRIDTAQHFKRHTKGAIVYTLVEINHLLSSESLILTSQLPKCLRNYLDVFLASNAKKLASHCNIDLAIELQPGKEPLYRLIYSLSQTELAALRDFLEENLAKGFI